MGRGDGRCESGLLPGERRFVDDPPPPPVGDGAPRNVVLLDPPLTGVDGVERTNLFRTPSIFVVNID